MDGHLKYVKIQDLKIQSCPLRSSSLSFIFLQRSNRNKELSYYRDIYMFRFDIDKKNRKISNILYEIILYAK